MATITKNTPAATPPAIGAADDFLGESIKGTAGVDGAIVDGAVVDGAVVNEAIVDGAVGVVDAAVPAITVDDAKSVEVLNPVGL